MKFKNQTEENVKYRLGNYKGFEWHTIRPGEIADIPEHIGVALKLTPIVEELIKEIEVETNEPSEEDPTNVDATFQEDPGETKKYKEKLIDIDGIGKKTAEKIMEKYPTEDKLRIAVQDGKEIHKRDDVDAAIKELFEA